MNNSEKPVVKENFTPQAEVEVWIARDKDNCLFMYDNKPYLYPGDTHFVDENAMQEEWNLSNDLFPSIQPGECKRAKIVLEEEL